MRGDRRERGRGFNRRYTGKFRWVGRPSTGGPRAKFVCASTRADSLNMINVRQSRASNTRPKAVGSPAEERQSITRRKVMGTLLVTAMPSLTGCNSVLGNSKKDALLERYQDGFSTYKEGAEKHNEAVIAYRSDEFQKVQSLIDEALAELQAAKTDFERVRQLAREIDNSDAKAIASSAVNQTDRLIEASNQLKRTAEGFANDNFEKAQESYEDYKETAAELRNQDLTEPQVLEQNVDDGVLDF